MRTYKLTIQDVQKIRAEAAVYSQRKLARLYGVSQPMIHAIIHNRKRID